MSSIGLRIPATCIAPYQSPKVKCEEPRPKAILGVPKGTEWCESAAAGVERHSSCGPAPPLGIALDLRSKAHRFARRSRSLLPSADRDAFALLRLCARPLRGRSCSICLRSSLTVHCVSSFAYGPSTPFRATLPMVAIWLSSALQDTSARRGYVHPLLWLRAPLRLAASPTEGELRSSCGGQGRGAVAPVPPDAWSVGAGSPFVRTSPSGLVPVPPDSEPQRRSLRHRLAWRVGRPNNNKWGCCKSLILLRLDL